MTRERAIAKKFSCAPKSRDEADNWIRIRALRCVACGSDMLLTILRRPMPDWRAHCNFCGSEYPVFVLLNRGAWQTLGKTTL